MLKIHRGIASSSYAEGERGRGVERGDPEGQGRKRTITRKRKMAEGGGPPTSGDPTGRRGRGVERGEGKP
jgi:hypothetical protein